MKSKRTEEAQPFSIFRVKPGLIPNPNLWVMRDTFKHLAEIIFMALQLPDPVIYTLKPVKWTIDYDKDGRFVKRLKVSFTLEFEQPKDASEDES